MRGRDHQRGHLGGYVDPEAMVPPDHPLRQIRPLVTRRWRVCRRSSISSTR
jgi:hypothetical protein